MEDSKKKQIAKTEIENLQDVKLVVKTEDHQILELIIKKFNIKQIAGGIGNYKIRIIQICIKMVKVNNNGKGFIIYNICKRVTQESREGELKILQEQ